MSITADPAVEFHDVVKRFHRVHAPMGLKYAMLHPAEFVRVWRSAPTFTALDGVSFTVKRGESLGICGRNGSGKSTTMTLMAGVMRPTSGRVVVRGRIAPLLALGAGFHPDLSGSDNITLNGLLLGLSRREIAERREAIIEFAGLREFINEPMRTYSSGMFMRLGFAVAAHTDPEVLLVDELLSVGDFEFQAKCKAKMHEFRKSGVTIVFVSHTVAEMEAMCDRAIWLDGGKARMDGTPVEVDKAYRGALGAAS